MLEAEWAFITSVGEVCGLVEAMLMSVVNEIVEDKDWEMVVQGEENRGEAIRSLTESGSQPWKRISYTEAIEHLGSHHQSHPFVFPPAWGNPLQSEHERWLAESFAKGPIFVTDYPATLKPFYMRLNQDEKTVACFDLLVPHLGELAGGSLREERLPYLLQSISRHDLKKEEYEWYVDLRRYGSAPHGGFGLGFERLIGWLGGIDNVRECIGMPRWAGRMLL